MCSLSQSRINTDSARERDSVLPFAPEERYVYSRAICPKPRAPEERYVVLSHTIELVGVGCPNPLKNFAPLRYFVKGLQFAVASAFRFPV